ncbi:MAG TPA: NAD-dependent epimerase/dehydratase family protein [Anaerolineae bacterium]|nr:NAD-dependent epimerase/dehydratase family protein [Anaerolineae bacterium]
MRDQAISLEGQTALVTGVAGFIGSHVAERLVALGVKVRGLARTAARAEWLAARGVEIVEGDLTDAESLRRAVRGCRFVFSIAGWVGQPRSFRAARRVSVEGTRALIEAAIGAGARRAVHTSSMAAYGPVAEGVIDETWPLRASDAYGAGKAESETVVFSYGDRIETSVIRPTQVYGPGGRTWTLRLVSMIRWGLPVLVDGGHGAFHPCYIDNLVDAYVLAVTRPEAVGQAFTIVDGVTTWRDFTAYYAHMIGRPARSVPAFLPRIGTYLAVFGSAITRRPPIGTPDMLQFVVGHSRYSHDKAGRLLGWSPRVSLDEGMRRTEVWLRETGRLP